MKLFEVINYLDSRNIKYIYDGDENTIINSYSSIYQYKEGSISWLRKIETLEAPGFCMPDSFTCLITQKGTPRINNATCQIWVDNPKGAFFDILEGFWGKITEASISQQAIIEEGAIIGKDVSIGPFTYISSKTIIGDGTRIGSNVTIKGKVTIGKECVIQSGAVLGEDGFAFIKEGNAQKFVKHYGGVTLEDHVSIGSQTCVCRGAIDDTYIGEYSKIDNLCL